MSEITLNVKVQGLEQLRETVALLLQQLKELGAGNPDTLVEVYAGGAVLPKVSVEIVEPWYPDDSGDWIEHDGSGAPEGLGEWVYILTRSERNCKKCTLTPSLVAGWVNGFNWSGSGGTNVVAYKEIV